jgi:flagellar biogenesis protein FliO
MLLVRESASTDFANRGINPLVSSRPGHDEGAPMPRTVFRHLMIACTGWGIALAFVGLSRADDPVPPTRHPISRTDSASQTKTKSSSTLGFWLSTGGIAAALAIFGAISLTAKKVRPASDSPSLRVVGRTSLSPRQSVYLVRVGERTLILGAGSQGPPTLLGEFTETPAAAAERTAIKAPHLSSGLRIGANG